MPALRRWRQTEARDSFSKLCMHSCSPACLCPPCGHSIVSPPSAAAHEPTLQSPLLTSKHAAPPLSPAPAVPTFCNGRALRDYQKVSLEWMANNCEQRINCILGDEVGQGFKGEGFISIFLQSPSIF